MVGWVLSVLQAPALACFESGVGRVGWVEESFVAVVGFVGGEQSGAVPGFDRADVHAESLSGLVDREQSLGAEPVLVAGELVGVADLQDDVGGERLVGARAAAGGVELFGGLAVGVIVEQSVEHREGVGVGLSCFPGAERDRDREAGGLPAAEADVQVELIGLVERDVLDQQAGDPFAFAGGCGGV